jgi:acyl dehydratase
VSVQDWAEVPVGFELDEHVDRPLTVTDFVRYQGASGDMNPIHHDPEFAKKAGYPGPFAVGMLQAGVLATYVTDRFGTGSVRRFKVQFREQAWPGDELTYRGQVVGRRDEDGQHLLDLELSAVRQTGSVHLRGWATVVVPG